MHKKGISTFGLLSPNLTREQRKVFVKILLGLENPALAILNGSFGTKWKNLNLVLRRLDKAKKRAFVEIHFSNEASRRSPGRLGKGDMFPDQDVSKYNETLERMNRTTKKRIKQRVNRIKQKICDFERRHDFVLSLGLEDNYTDIAALKLYEVLKEYWPHPFVRNPVDQSKEPQMYEERDYLELHHYHPFIKYKPKHKNLILNGDGQDLNFNPGTGKVLSGVLPAQNSEVKNWLNQGKNLNAINLVWCAPWQGLHIENPPQTRERKFLIQKSDIATTLNILNV